MTMLVALGGGGPPLTPHSCALGTDLVSKAFSGLLRGCCSKQLTAGLPATGTVIALSTREVMACTARTWVCVLSVSSCKDSPASARHEQPDASKHCVPFPAPPAHGLRGYGPECQRDKPSRPGAALPAYAHHHPPTGDLKQT